MKIAHAREVQANFKEYFPQYGSSISRDSTTIRLNRCSNNKDLSVIFSHLPGSEIHSPGLLWGFGPEPEDMNLARISADSPAKLLQIALVANELRYFFEVVLELKFDERYSEDKNWYLNMIISSANFGAYMLDVSKSYANIQDPTDDEVRGAMLAVNTLERHGKSISRLYNEIVGTFVAETESLSNDIVLIYAALAGATSPGDVVAKSQVSFSPDWDFELVTVLESLTEIFHSSSFEPNLYGYYNQGREVTCNGFEVTRPDGSKVAYLNEGGLWALYEQDSDSGEQTRIERLPLISESSSLHAMTVFVGIEALHLMNITRSAPKFSRSLRKSEEDLGRAKKFIESVAEGREYVLDATAFQNAKIFRENFAEFGL